MAVHELFVYMCVKKADDAVEFYCRAFGAVEHMRLTEPGGRVGHVQIKLGEHVVMLAEEFPEYGILAPRPNERLPFCIHLHVDDADEAMRAAVAAGGTVVREVADQFYGERTGRMRDPFGYEWLLGHSIEPLTPEEMQRRYTEMTK
jgi:uncharacterized glyoxalase superfamily protein PhnB